MKISSATSAKATAPRRRTGQSSGKPPSRTSDRPIALSGASDPPDPSYNAFRKDLADVALAGRVIASHYAEPLARTLAAAAALRSSASDEGELLRDLAAGEPFDLLDNSLGWAWGYAGAERRVGYIRAEALAN